MITTYSGICIFSLHFSDETLAHLIIFSLNVLRNASDSIFAAWLSLNLLYSSILISSSFDTNSKVCKIRLCNFDYGGYKLSCNNKLLK